jgi:hypothetical protein
MGTGNSLRGLNIVDQNPSGGTLLVADNAAPSNFDYVNFLTGAGGSPTDYTGMAIILRDTTQTIANYHFNKITVSTGPDQVTDKSWTPSFWVAPAQHFGNNAIEVTMDRTSVNRRGIGWGGGDGGDASVGGVAGFVSNWSYRQGGIIPYFTCMACTEYAPLTFNDASQDTEGQPLEAALLVSPSSGYLGPRITAHYPTGGAQAPLFSGLRPSYADVDAIFSKASAFQNATFCTKRVARFRSSTHLTPHRIITRACMARCTPWECRCTAWEVTAGGSIYPCRLTSQLQPAPAAACRQGYGCMQ